MSNQTVKRKVDATEHEEKDIEDFFRSSAQEDITSDTSNDDTTDSEESEYSGLEDEGSDSDGELSDDEDEESDDEEVASEDEGEVSSEDENDTANNNTVTSEEQPGASTSTEGLDNSQRPKKKRAKGKGEGSSDSQKSEGGTNKNDKEDEYAVDSSDEEDVRNTVGNVPMEWYRDLAHIGYDLEGKRITKPPSGDELDEFLSKMDNPDYWRTVMDKSTGQKVRLTDADAELVQRMRRGLYADADFDPYKPWVDFFTFEKMIHPVTNRPEHKRSFIPSKWEKLKVGRLVHAIKMGWIKPKVKKDENEDQFYQLWADDDQADITKRYRDHIPAPKLQLPGHEESYNPPPEYLLTEEEELAWREKEPEERKLNFVPRSYSCLRKVPAYSQFINERFQRCLDLYLCPRQRKMRMNVDPEDLIPKLPKPKDLQPFPTTQAIIYKGHTSLIRSVSVDPNGQWIMSGSDDGTVRLWEVATGRCMKTLRVGGVVKCVAWNPNTSFSLVAATVDDSVIIINPGLSDKLVCSRTDEMLQSFEPNPDQVNKLPVEWHVYDGDDRENGLRLRVTHAKKVQDVVWHGRGDYFAVVQPDAGNMAVLIHQLSKRRTQNPFKKSKGLVQKVAFHPTRPFLLVATQRYVRVYNLLSQEMTKKLMTNCKWVSSLAVHPGGDNVIVGSYDCKLCWFDLDLSSKPYQTLRHHKAAVRHVAFHPRYPLFASASDDASVIVCHGKVFNDLLQNPLIVPVKILRGHERHKELGVLSCVFHPTQPWLFSSAADNTIRLYT